MRHCVVPFCDKNTPRSKDRFCSSHRNEFFIRKLTPFKELIPLWAFRKCKIHGFLKFQDWYFNKTNNTFNCKVCKLSQIKKNYCPIKRKAKLQKEKNTNRNSAMKRRFGISINDYESILSKQNYQCAICNKSSSKQHFDIDHCHKTKKVRGLLCRSCNMGLGYFKDSPNLLNQAAQYLRRE